MRPSNLLTNLALFGVSLAAYIGTNSTITIPLTTGPSTSISSGASTAIYGNSTITASFTVPTATTTSGVNGTAIHNGTATTTGPTSYFFSGTMTAPASVTDVTILVDTSSLPLPERPSTSTLTSLIVVSQTPVGPTQTGLSPTQTLGVNAGHRLTVPGLQIGALAVAVYLLG